MERAEIKAAERLGPMSCCENAREQTGGLHHLCLARDRHSRSKAALKAIGQAQRTSVVLRYTIDD